jgi:N-glycosylase/DNA lyase
MQIHHYAFRKDGQGDVVQTAFALVDGEIRSWTLPPRDHEVMPGVRWGSPGEILSPAYWAALARASPEATHGFVCQDGDLASEVGFCLLGGFGITAELGAAAHDRLRAAGVFKPDWRPDRDAVAVMLKEPLTVKGRPIHYRFPDQRATRISQAMAALQVRPPRTHCAFLFRDDLMALPGVGPKTASWIVRNLTGSDALAILDVHVVRAGQAMGLFRADVRLPHDYAELEGLFLEFANKLGVGAGALDALIWTQMRHLSARVLGHC